MIVVTGDSKQKKLPTENQLRTKWPRKSFLTSSQTSDPVTAGRMKPRERRDLLLFFVIDEIILPVAERRQAMMAIMLSERDIQLVMIGTSIHRLSIYPSL